jgi:hypothetical protein
MRDRGLLSLLNEYRRRLRWAGVAWTMVLASAGAGVILVLLMVSDATAAVTRLTAWSTLLAIALVGAIREWRRWTPQRVAQVIETRARTLDNLVVTAEEIASGRAGSPHPAVCDELFAQALQRLHAQDRSRVQPLRSPVVLAAVSVLATVTLLMTWPLASPHTATVTATTREASRQPLTSGDLRVVITPPAYAAQRVIEAVNPTTVTALELSAVRLEIIDPGGEVVLVPLDGPPTRFSVADNRAFYELTATASRPLVIRQSDDTGASADRLVHLRVDRDQRPAVTLREPARDLLFAEGKGLVPFRIEARDDVGVHALSLRYTRVSGSGETFTFEEGEWPIEISRDSAVSWQGRGALSLEQLQLQDGDTLVYRAVAHDGKPGADPAASDTYLIEIGRTAGVASTGFALPEERDRQAVSQQMLIIKTERLHADRAKVSADTFAEQARLLAIEQRMVKAEFVFMTGGEVADEVEEATHAHELAEGRLENTGQVELLAAIREMSRAEARLNAADTAEALEFERAALKALQRAFDRRRYLLRTLPERARIDVSRRLTGELASAQSSSLARAASAEDAVAAHARALWRDLGTASAPGGPPAVLASRLLALDTNAGDIQHAALQLAAARDAEAQQAALRDAQAAIVRFLRQRSGTHMVLPLARAPVTGQLVQELTPPGVRR